MLDDDFALLTVLSQASDAFTAGTAPNLVIRAKATSVAATLDAGMAQATAWIGANPTVSPDTILIAEQNAEYLARATASRAWVSRLLSILDRQ